jgi:hypothetical protein
MRLYVLSVLILLLSCFTVASDLAIRPTTTLSALIANNTSAANNFATQTNGNLGATNVSKMDVHSLLYTGSATRVLAHLQLWFGTPEHISVGYSSNDPAQAHAQVEDMISRGIQGVIMDWYGPNNSIDQAAQLMMKEAETHAGFTFAIMIDAGALKGTRCDGCSGQDAIIQDLQYLELVYFPSPAYLRVNGEPVVTNFNVDLFAQVDWKAISATLSSNPVFLFQDSAGFSHSVSYGAYSWVMPSTTDLGMNYLANFYRTGKSYVSETSVGASYKGFNDTLASWGSKRIMSQQCGTTWLQTFMEANSFFGSGDQLSMLQVVTWNDYEEGTEIESGIDNCVNILASVTGDSLEWGITGDESTVDHYSVYVSADGQNLMLLGEEPTGIWSLNLCSYALAPANYTVFTQAVGKPSVANHLSAPLPYAPQCQGGSSSPGPAINITSTPQVVSLGSGGAADLSLSVASSTLTAGSAVSLSCTNVPTGMSCVFAPSTVTAGPTLSKSTLTISGTVQSAGKLPGSNRPSLPLYGSVAAFAFGGVLLAGPQSWRAYRAILLIALVAIVMTLSSCGAATSPHAAVSSPGMASGTYSIVVQASSGRIVAATTVLVTTP